MVIYFRIHVPVAYGSQGLVELGTTSVVAEAIHAVDEVGYARSNIDGLKPSQLDKVTLVAECTEETCSKSH
jgi:hypothetical protein